LLIQNSIFIYKEEEKWVVELLIREIVDRYVMEKNVKKKIL